MSRINIRSPSGFNKTAINWVNLLCDHLEKQGIDVEVLGCDKLLPK